MYPGNLEWPILFQISAIDKSISIINVFKGILSSQEIDKISDYGEIWDSVSTLIKDYEKRLLCNFPDIKALEPFDINTTSIQNFAHESFRICIGNENFKNNDAMPPRLKSHKIYIDENHSFYVRLYQKLNNFEKYRIINVLPDDVVAYYIKHKNLKQYLSSNHMFSIIFSIIYSSEGIELAIIWALLHRNQYFLNLLFDLGGIDILKDFIVQKQFEESKTENESKEYLNYLFNIAWNEPLSTKFDSNMEKSTLIPKFSDTRMDFLDILILIAKKGKLEVKFCFKKYYLL